MGKVAFVRNRELCSSDALVRHDGEIVGEIKKFCCGIDFILKSNPQSRFSILGVRNFSVELKTCIDAIMTLKLPKREKDFAINITHTEATDPIKLKKIQTTLNKI